MSSIFNNKNIEDDLSDTEKEDIEVIMNKNDIENTIPENNVDKPDIKLRETLTEYRWRYLKIKDIEYIEISYKEPNSEERLYMDSDGKWIKKNVDEYWNNYVYKEKYSYS
tara:strand:+ start:240 stop:569 length:330 start_codon:yes stop_codon:yes gene_type:complete